MGLDQKTLERLAARLPGFDVGELRVLETVAQILPDDFLDEREERIAAQVADDAKVAGPPMINKDGRPTILKIVMWMCHADSVNLNGDAFVGEELQAVAGTLFREPNFGVMDWNHAAVFSWNDDPKLMGVWYKADWAFDKAANAWGILVTGMMFAWLFPEQTDALIAEQTRNGSIKGSMACIPKSVEFGDISGKRAAILHNPVFFTHSLLDVPPADPSAVGLCTEDPDTGSEALHEQMLATASADPVDTQLSIEVDPARIDEVRAAIEKVLASRGATEEGMTPEQIAELEKANVDLKAEIAALTAKVEALTAKDKPKDDEEEDVPPFKKKAEELETENAELKRTVAELTTSRDALAAELETARAAITAHEATIAELTQYRDAAEAAKAADATAATLAARLESLPESFRKAHLKRSDETRADLEAEWATMSDEKWEFHKANVLLFGLQVASTKSGYVDLSRKEGVLVQADVPVDDMRSKLKSSLKHQAK
jgi:hypothetical protein